MAGLDGEVALGIEAHRAVVEVGRAHPQQDVIDHHHLGVDIDVPAVLGDGAVEAEAIVPVRLAKLLHEQRPGRSHGLLLEPAGGAPRVDHDHLGP